MQRIRDEQNLRIEKERVGRTEGVKEWKEREKEMRSICAKRMISVRSREEKG